MLLRNPGLCPHTHTRMRASVCAYTVTSLKVVLTEAALIDLDCVELITVAGWARDARGINAAFSVPSFSPCTALRRRRRRTPRCTPATSDASWPSECSPSCRGRAGVSWTPPPPRPGSPRSVRVPVQRLVPSLMAQDTVSVVRKRVFAEANEGVLTVRVHRGSARPLCAPGLCRVLLPDLRHRGFIRECHPCGREPVSTVPALCPRWRRAAAPGRPRGLAGRLSAHLHDVHLLVCCLPRSYSVFQIQCGN